MRPSIIPDEEVAALDGVRATIMPPRNDLDSGIAPVEVLRDTIDGADVIRIRLLPEEGDLERLAAGEPLWLTWYSSVLVPFGLAFAEPVEPAPKEYVHRAGCCACQEPHVSGEPEWSCPSCGHWIAYPTVNGLRCSACRQVVPAGRPRG